MICRYCSANNNDHDHRCGKCGRRLYIAAVRPEAIPPASRTATARALQPEMVPQPVLRPEPSVDGVPRQGVLFSGAREEGPYLVRPSETAQVRRDVLSRLSPSAAGRPAAVAAGGRPSAAQQTIPFAQPAARPDDPLSQSGIYCDAPVAVPVHRAMATAIDCSMVLLAVALFLSILWLADVRPVFDSITLPFYALAIGVTFGFYQLMWALAGMDSVGLRWAGLRLVTFEGDLPDRERRLWRLIALTISAVPLGMGLLWALVDEERLAWHDHMSKTFPTLRRAPARLRK
jgi:uncharacterized RDD family membrane protein YckC